MPGGEGGHGSCPQAPAGPALRSRLVPCDRGVAAGRKAVSTQNRPVDLACWDQSRGSACQAPPTPQNRSMGGRSETGFSLSRFLSSRSIFSTRRAGLASIQCDVCGRNHRFRCMSLGSEAGSPVNGTVLVYGRPQNATLSKGSNDPADPCEPPVVAHKLLSSASYAKNGKGSQTQKHTTTKIR